MKIADIIREKGADVTTVRTGSTMNDVVTMLAEQRIGAVPVSDDGRTLSGILSERDVVRGIAAGAGNGFGDMRVDELMTSTVHTCSPEATLSEVMTLMNERRIRHVPVVEDGALVGILSIRDLISARLREAEIERQQMADYIANRTFN